MLMYVDTGCIVIKGYNMFRHLRHENACCVIFYSFDEASYGPFQDSEQLMAKSFLRRSSAFITRIARPGSSSYSFLKKDDCFSTLRAGGELGIVGF
jgi:hypothetical protein